ncbi:nucleotidyltransferase domain-containing protein [Aeromonas veronii]|uniref:nucleotidyltransferase domain-containing protein n=1 Tax=Aeromonas veronii TaxID=654 RepID=UPI0029D7AA65|nr:nucleotidyltransferase domain-containing protein [Aeromonas veronii]MDX7874800.1 nucleotidyltransferase domain-containing protein [Aeromonas veronii]
MFTAEINELLDALVQDVQGIASIWLIGSRANGTAKPESDWDFFIFGDCSVSEQIKSKPEFHLDNIDLLVVAKDGTFEKPYGSKKSGDLNDWKWQITTPETATYQSSKCENFAPDGDGFTDGRTPFITETLKAVRVRGT